MEQSIIQPPIDFNIYILMKYLIPILLFLLPALATANLRDTIPTAVPQLFGGKLYEFGNYVVIDSLLMIKGGDTTGGIPRWPSLKYRMSDNRWYGYFGSSYKAFLNGSDTLSLSRRIDSSKTPPGGSNTQIQYNNLGTFAGDAGLTYNDIQNYLTTDTIRQKKNLADSIFMGSFIGYVPDSSRFNGTSITAGNYANPIATNRYTKLVAEALRTIEINNGLSGYTLQNPTPAGWTNSFISVYTSYIPPKSAHSKYLFFAWGENDAAFEYAYTGVFTFDTSFFKRDFTTVINFAKSKGWANGDMRIISPFYQMPTNCPENIQQKYVDASHHFADSMGIQWIDVYSVGKEYNSLLLFDNIHPSNYGHGIHATNIVRQLNLPIQIKTGENLINTGTTVLNKLQFNSTDTVKPGFYVMAINPDGSSVKLPGSAFVNIDNTNLPINGGNASILGNFNAGKGLRAMGSSGWTSGQGGGFEIEYISGQGYLTPFDWTTISSGNIYTPFSRLVISDAGPPSPFTNLYVAGTASARGIYSAGGQDVTYNTNTNATALNLLVKGDTVGEIVTYGPSGYRNTAINGEGGVNTLIGTFHDNTIGKLQVAGKITTVTDSSGSPINMAWIDIDGSIRKAAAPSSGIYTPTLNNGTNVAASTAYACQYMRVGNTVTVSGKVDIDPTTTGATSIGVSLPIASALTNDYQAGGTASSGIELYAGSIKADAANDRAQIDFTIPASGSTSNVSWFFSFTYQIL